MYDLYKKDYSVIILSIAALVVCLINGNFFVAGLALFLASVYIGNKISFIFLTLMLVLNVLNSGIGISMLLSIFMGYLILTMFAKSWYQGKSFNQRIFLSSGSSSSLNDVYRTASMFGLLLSFISIISVSNYSIAAVMIQVADSFSFTYTFYGFLLFSRLNKDGAYLMIIGLLLKIVVYYLANIAGLIDYIPFLLLIAMSGVFLQNERA